MQIIKNYVKENSSLLFKYHSVDYKKALLDNKGFYFTDETQKIYNQIKDKPHVYVAWCANQNGYYYVGKSFQIGGRWKRQHAYHLGTLAHHLLNTIRYDDQNHMHWIENWMLKDTLKVVEQDTYSVELKELINICFIPFEIYSNQNYINLEKSEIRKINSIFEKQLIQSYKQDNKVLLNIQHN
jgi:hypothetical protein